MEYSKNPFTPTFGSVPPFLAGREHILRDINRGFINGPGDPNLSTIFTGARGTGKTALLSLLSETALEHGWIAANVSAMPGMLEDIIERTKEAADSYLSQPHARINGVQIGPVGIDWKRMGVASNYASQYKRRLLEDGVIGERGRGLVGFDIPAFREFLNEKAF